jgi:hypothetical protein
MKATSQQIYLVRQTFAALVEKLNEHHAYAHSPSPSELTFTTVLFQVDSMTWFFSNNDGVITMEESLRSAGKQKQLAESTVVTDAGTMVKICKGAMSFPAAYLSGKVKFTGDQKLLKSIGIPLKDALEEVRLRKITPPAGQAAALSIPVAGPTSALGAVKLDVKLDVKLVEAFASNFTYNLNDTESMRQTIQAPKEGVVQYKIEVKVLDTEEAWYVSHRYSHFVQLRQDLIEQGYGTVPSLASRSALFNSFQRVLHSRIISLGFFISECISLVGLQNDTLNQFLAKPLDRTLSTQSCTGSTTASGLSSSEHAATLPETGSLVDEAVHEYSANDVDGGGDDDTEAEHGGYPNAALEHAWSSPISWAHQNLPQSRYLIQELQSQKRAIESSGHGSASHTKDRLSHLLVSLQNWLLIAVTGVLAFYFYDVPSPDRNASHARWKAEMAFKLVLTLLLLVPRTRRTCLFYCAAWLVTFSFARTVLAAAVAVLGKYSEHRTMYESHLRWAAVPNGVLEAPQQFRTPPCVTRMLLNVMPSTVHRLLVGTFEVLLRTGKRILLSRLSGYDAASLLLNGGEPSASSLLALTSGLWRLLDWQVAAMLAVFVGVTVVLRSPGLSRALWIYTLGVSLIAIYGSLQVACVLLRLPQATSEALFARLDTVVAPFVVAQVGQLRSVFVKFAQYFGGRSDVVSPIWTNLLSQLHDACPASSEDYVRRTLELELGEVMHGIVGTGERCSSDGDKKKFVLEDVFESFERVPIASASIGQVHTATLKHAVIMQILHAQQQEAQQSCTKRWLAREDVGTPLSAQTTHDSDGDSGGSSAHISSPLPAPRILSSTSTPVDKADTQRVAPATGAAEGGDAADLNWYESATDTTFTCASSAEASQLVSVVVKVQHEGIAPLMVADMQIVLVLIKWAARIDSRWQVKVSGVLAAY